MSDAHARLRSRLHLALALGCLALYAGSPWLAMVRRLRADSGIADYAHVALGLAMLLLAAPFATLCLRGGGWRWCFPWLAGAARDVGRDLAGLLRGRLPAAEGGGLDASVQGLLLVAVLATAVSGAAWLLAGGGASALGWRAAHVYCAHVCGGLLTAHAVFAGAHALEFARH